MKKWTITLLWLMFWGSTNLHAQFAGGNGSVADPFQITTAQELDNVRHYMQGSHFKLMNNIDVSEFLKDSVRGWLPIGDTYNPFFGVFNGNGWSVTGLFINRPDDWVGLFGQIREAVICNLGVVGGQLTGSNGGGLAGHQINDYPTMESKIDNCFTSIRINTNGQVGGLIGRTHYMAVKNCYAMGGITNRNVSQAYTGGLIGLNQGTHIGSYNENVIKCYAVGKITASDALYSIGGLLGDFFSYKCYISSYFDSQVAGTANATPTYPDYPLPPPAYNPALTTVAIQQQSSFIDWDFAPNGIWEIWEEYSYPYFQYQSAPVVLTVSNSDSIGGVRKTGYDINNRLILLDSLRFYDTMGVCLGSLISPAEYWTYHFTTPAKGEVSVIAYERGKAVSYPVSKTVVFIPKYTLTFNGNGGTPTLQSQKVSENTKIYFLPVVFREGYTFINWNTLPNGTGTVYTQDSSYTFGRDTTLYAAWAINRYKIHSSASGEGSVSPLGDTLVPFGGNITFTLTPNTGYQIKNVLVDNQNITTNLVNNTYTFSNVNAPHSLTVAFVKEIPVAITKQPQSQKLCAGENHTFAIAANGNTLLYQWQKQNGSGWENVTQQEQYTLYPATVADNGSYRVIVYNSFSADTSLTAVLNVGIPPSAIIAFNMFRYPVVNCNITTNGGYKFTAFQWYKNDTLMQGATDPYIKFPDDGSNHTYHCVMTTDKGETLRVCPFSETSLSIADLLNTQNPIKVYPNPAQYGVHQTITLSNVPKGSTLAVYSLAGSLLLASPLENTLDISMLRQGIYSIQILLPSGSRRFIKFIVL